LATLPLSPAAATPAVKGSAAAPASSGTTSLGNLSSLLRGADIGAGGAEGLEEYGEELDGPAAAGAAEVEGAPGEDYMVVEEEAVRWAPPAAAGCSDDALGLVLLGCPAAGAACGNPVITTRSL
jgi:hypothetical protein